MEGLDIATIVLLIYYGIVFFADLVYKSVKLIKKSSCFGSSIEINQANSPTKESGDEIVKKITDLILEQLKSKEPLVKIISQLEQVQNGKESTSSHHIGSGITEKV